jgi:hypothetical protein
MHEMHQQRVAIPRRKKTKFFDVPSTNMMGSSSFIDEFMRLAAVFPGKGASDKSDQFVQVGFYFFHMSREGMSKSKMPDSKCVNSSAI